MNEAIIILLNMRGGCATVGDKVHTLFRVNNRRRRIDQQSPNLTASDSVRLTNEASETATRGAEIIDLV
jgi:hypothetical protein